MGTYLATRRKSAVSQPFAPSGDSHQYRDRPFGVGYAKSGYWPEYWLPPMKLSSLRGVKNL